MVRMSFVGHTGWKWMVKGVKADFFFSNGWMECRACNERSIGLWDRKQWIGFVNDMNDSDCKKHA